MQTWNRFVSSPLSTTVKRSTALLLAAVVVNADVAIACACAVALSAAAYGLMDLPLWMAAAIALVSGPGVCVASAPLCGGWMWRRAGQIRRWGAPDTLHRPPAPVDPLAELLARQPTPVAAPKSKSTEPRSLEWYELSTWLCPQCEQPAAEGTHAWEDRGPFQLLSNHRLTCPDGHRWTDSTDGG